MNSSSKEEEPIELISHIKAIFYFLGGIYIPTIYETGRDVSIMKISFDNKNIQRDSSVTPFLIEERINNIQGIDPQLKLMIAKTLPKIISMNLEIQNENFKNKKCIYITFDEFLDFLRNECELLELE